MTAKAGERAQKTGDFYCDSCGEKVHVTKGDKIPKCPNGHSNVGTRRETRSSHGLHSTPLGPSR